MKVLVLGGTGTMGMHLVHLLSQKGIETVVTTRKYRCAEGKVRYLRGNAQNMEFLQPVLDEYWDAIIDFMVYNTSSFRKRMNLILDSTSQYVFLSSARVYSNSEQHITETSSRLLDVSQDKDYLLTDEYSLTKARQEDVLRNSKRKNWTIIRPYITYGENRFQLGVLEKEEWLYRALQGRTIVFSTDINPKVTALTYGLDVSKAIIALVGSSCTLGEAFHITTEVSRSWKDIFTIYLGVLENYFGRKPKILLLDMEKFLECKPAKYQIVYDRLFNRQFDNSKISRYFDTSSFIKIEIGLKSCLEKFLENPEFLNINWKKEALKDRQTKEHTPLYEISGIKQKIIYIYTRYLTINILKH